MPKNVQTNRQLCSFPMLVKLLKILQDRLQQYMYWGLPDIQAEFRKGGGARDQIANICQIIEKARESRKTAASVTTRKPLTVWITTNWKIIKEMGIPDHLTCVLRNLYAYQEATVRTLYGTTYWFKLGSNFMVQNWESSMTKLFIVTLFV